MSRSVSGFLVLTLCSLISAQAYAGEGKLAGVSAEFTSAKVAQTSVVKVGCGFGPVSTLTLKRIKQRMDLLALFEVSFLFSDGAVSTFQYGNRAFGHPLLGKSWVYTLQEHPCLESVSIRAKAYPANGGSKDATSQVNLLVN